MKTKRFFLILWAITCVAVVSAKELSFKPRAVGLRAGYGLGASYQNYVFDNSMLTLDLDFFGLTKGFNGSLTYDWINPFNLSIPWNEKGEMNWYLGVGLSAGTYFHSYVPKEFTNFWFGPTGRVGLEYRFWFPLQISFEWRPVIGFKYARLDYLEFWYDPSNPLEQLAIKEGLNGFRANNAGAKTDPDNFHFFKEGLYDYLTFALTVRYYF